MYSVVSCAVVHGIDSRLVRVETDVSSGMPVFDMVGFLGSEVKEARERVRTALKNCDYKLPVKRITVNISPASIRKHGTGFDLAIAVSVLAASEVIESENLNDIVMIGELGLNGNIYGVRGVLSMVLAAAEEGKKACVVPKENYSEAVLASNIDIVPVNSLSEVVAYLNDNSSIVVSDEPGEGEGKIAGEWDFKDVNGQKLLRRACEIAAAGMHNLLMIGPPGSGKSFAARCMPSILPPLNKKEQLELCKIYSVCGEFESRREAMEQRPFRNPHHTVTTAGLIGGGMTPHPGEISLAHRGILFLDELTEFKRDVIETLRQPMEQKKVIISRETGNFEYPSDFMLVAAMNPCKCGYYPDLSRCRCSYSDINRYFGKLSQPMLDRIDICVEAPRLTYMDLARDAENESSEDIRTRVIKAHAIQQMRYKNKGYYMNSEIPVNDLASFCSLGSREQRYMEQLYSRLNLTARTYHKLLRVARTVADLDASAEIRLKHLEEVLCYRGIERWDWERSI